MFDCLLACLFVYSIEVLTSLLEQSLVILPPLLFSVYSPVADIELKNKYRYPGSRDAQIAPLPLPFSNLCMYIVVISEVLLWYVLIVMMAKFVTDSA